MLLCDAGEPLSTTEVRERFNRGRDRALVAEQVYRALVSLQQTGAVRRVHVAGSRKRSGKHQLRSRVKRSPELALQRRGPWLSGLIVALLGAMWLCAEVAAGVVQLVAGWLGGVGV
jgi:hypothetical protein